MKNENVFIMEQPELGKKIQELRKLKGLTQEELVEKCNINVRTIQRIEAGEVSPRSFTIKTILEALGVDSKSFFRTSVHEDVGVQFSKEDRSSLRMGWISAIFFTLFVISGLIVESYLLSNDYEVDGELMYRVISGVFSLVSLFFFLRAYKVLGDRYGNNTLISASYAYFIIDFALITFTIVLTVFEIDTDVLEIISGVVMILLLGVGEILLGLGIQKLKEAVGQFAQVVGLIKIVNGAMLVTILLSPIAIFLTIPILILEIVLLYQIAQKAER